MTSEKINGAFTLEIPEGFEVMSSEDLRKLYQNENADRWGMWDRERHILITVAWQRVNALLSFLADIKSVAKRNEQLIAKGYANNDYKMEGFFSSSAGNIHMEGYRFSYTLQGIPQKSETLLMKLEKNIYSITCVRRAENAEECADVFPAVIASLKA